MATINADWGKCIKDLLEAHNLSYRGAMLKSGGQVSHTTIKDWVDGVVPHDYKKAWIFLQAFSRDEAIACLKTADLPIPPDWVVPSNPVQAVDIALRQTAPELSDFDKERILDLVKEVTKEVDGED
jgi:hypothetical protein